jgi:hypothetical protein
VTRTFRDGHTATWWAVEARLGWWGPDGNTRPLVATTDPAGLPEESTWYLATDLPRPGSLRAADSPGSTVTAAQVAWRRCSGWADWRVCNREVGGGFA